MDTVELTSGGTYLAVVIAGCFDTCDVFRGNVLTSLERRDFHVFGLSLPDVATHLHDGVLSSLVDMFVISVKHVLDKHNSHPPLLVCHGFGSVIAFECMSRHPHMFSAVVCLDVPGHMDWKRGASSTPSSQCCLRKWIVVVAVQLWVLLSFYLSKYIPVVPELSLDVLGLLVRRPLYLHALHPNRLVLPQPNMCIPHVAFMYSWIFGRDEPVTMRSFVPIFVPVLYMYGLSKPFQLHSEQWLRHIAFKHQSDHLSKVVAVADGGHWFFAEGGSSQMIALQHIDAFLSRITTTDSSSFGDITFKL